MSEPHTSFAVSIDPGELHFSAAHFITIGNSCENLHGHNFHVRVDARGGNTDDAFVVDFVALTRVAAAVCRTLHDRVLLPGESGTVRVQRYDAQVYVQSFDKHFVLPAENCAILPLANTTAEMLAQYVCDRILQQLGDEALLGRLQELEVGVEEADRQWGICRRGVGG